MRDISNLEIEFRTKAFNLISECKNRDVIMIPYCTVRSPRQQAKLWRQSRSSEEIEKTIDQLKQERAYYLIEILEEVGPQYGRWATNALPGTSWHQFGEAMDCFSLRNGNANWDSESYEYNLYAELAEKTYGLIAGFYWKTKDAVHVQKRKENVLDCYTWEEVDEIMKRKYSRRR